MTDRLKGYIVTLETDIRVDDAEVTTQAIRMIKGALSVDPMVSDSTDWIARQRVKAEVSEKLWQLVREL